MLWHFLLQPVRAVLLLHEKNDHHLWMALSLHDRLGDVWRERSDDWFSRVEWTSVRPKILEIERLSCKKYGIVASFPWTVKPLIGMISDGVPIFGYNKRWYIAASSLIGSGAIYFIATYKFDRSNGLYYIAGLTLINAQVAIADLLTEGKYAEAMRYNPSHSASMVSYVWGNITLGGI